MAFADGNWRDNPKYQERMNYYAPMVNQAVQQYGLEPQAADLIQGILGVESRWGLAKNLDKPGAAGELGIAQLTPGYRQQYGVKNPLDEQEAINAIAAYVSSARKRGAEWDLIPVGYNAGDGRLRQMLRGAKTRWNKCHKSHRTTWHVSENLWAHPLMGLVASGTIPLR